MTEQIENLDSSNEENYAIEENDDIDAIKEKFQKLSERDKKNSEANKHLFERAKKSEGELKEFKGKYEPEKKPEAKLEKSEEMDYGQLAFLSAKGIEEDADIEFIKGIMKKTGEELKSVIKDEFVQSKLKRMKEEREAEKGIPATSKRSGGNARDTVAYWIAKGELPPAEMKELRKQVVNEKIRIDRERPR
jgi:hypothetical protein